MGGGAESRAAGSCGPDAVDHGHSATTCSAACPAACPCHAATMGGSACNASCPCHAAFRSHCNAAVITGVRHLGAWLSAACNSCPTVAIAPLARQRLSAANRCPPVAHAPVTARQRPSAECVVVHLQGGHLQGDLQGLVLAIIILMNQPLPPIHHPPSTTLPPPHPSTTRPHLLLYLPDIERKLCYQKPGLFDQLLAKQTCANCGNDCRVKDLTRNSLLCSSCVTLMSARQENSLWGIFNGSTNQLCQEKHRDGRPCWGQTRLNKSSCHNNPECPGYNP